MCVFFLFAVVVVGAPLGRVRFVALGALSIVNACRADWAGFEA